MIVAAVIVVLLLGVDLFVYRGLHGVRRAVIEAWTALEQTLTHRADAISALHDSATAYIPHEDQLVQSVAAALQTARTAGTPPRRAKAEEELSSAAKALTALVTTHPDLQANDSVASTMFDIAKADRELGELSQRYNEMVDAYNSRIETPPWSAIARAFKFTARERFDASDYNDENGAQP